MFRVRQKPMQSSKHVGKHKHPKAMGFLQTSREAEIHTIPKT